MKKMLVLTTISVVLMSSTANFAYRPGLLFNVSASGNTLTITTTIPNHTYHQAGIKIRSAGYSLANESMECAKSSTGFCLFSVSSTQSKSITISGNTGKLSVELCLNGAGPMSCQNYDNIPITATPTPPPVAKIAKYLYVASPYGNSTDSVFVCLLNSTDGSILSCANAGGHPDLDGSNPQGIAINSAGTIAYITDGNGDSIVYQCNINHLDGTFSSCLAINVTTPSGYISGYGMIALNNANTIAYIVDNNNASPRVITCNIVNGLLNGTCIDAGAHNITDSGEGITLNQANTIGYIADYSQGLYVCGVSGLTVQTTCVLRTSGGGATFSGPSDVAFNADQSLIYIADYSGSTLYACKPDFTVCTAVLSLPSVGGVVINGNKMAYVTNFGSIVYSCPVRPDGTLEICTSTSPSGLSGAIGLALSYN